jgi:glutaconate CoA-transferase subunit B
VGVSAPEHSRDELLACFVAGEMTNDDRCFVGANLAVPRAGNLLAHLTHAPDLKVGIGLVSTNLIGEPEIEPFKFSTDYRMSRFAEAEIIHNDIFDNPRLTSTVFFVGGMQIDRYGNTNLIGLRGADGGVGVRGPGSLGTVSSAHYCDRYYLYTAVHDPRVLVERCDYVSVLGHGDGGDHRARLGLDRFNGGPSALISPLGIFDFETPDHRMRVRSLHPGVELDTVTEATGFELVVPDEIPVTAEPTAEQLRLLRERIDVEGVLRKAGVA